MLKNIIKSSFYSFIISFLFVFWKVLSGERIVNYNFVYKFLEYTQVTFLSLLVFFLLVSFFIYLYINKSKIINDYIYKYRWIIAIIILLFCVIFKISGSSIGSWMYVTQEQMEDKDLLIGPNRSAHADEYCVYTPMTISQFYNKNQKYPYFSDTLRATKTDTFIVYGQPVKDFFVLFRPFHIPYLFLDLERGFSFYWCSRIIVLFMLTFEFFMLFTRKNKLLSFVSTVLVTFSPTIQWWISVNSLVEMIIFGELFILLLNLYINSKYKLRILFCILLAYTTFAYTLTFYPAWQIPFAYMFLVFTIYLIVENRDKFCIKKDGLIFVLYIAILFLFVYLLLLKSGNTIQNVTSTVYPGKRVSNGGGSFFDLFHYPYTLTLALTSLSFHVNSEIWGKFTSFFDFFPIGIIFSMIVLFKQKSKNKLLVLTLCLYVFLFVYISFGFPEFISRITLMSHATSFRAFSVLSFINLFLLIYSLSLIEFKIKLSYSVIYSLILTYIIITISIIRNINYYSHYLLIILVPVVFLSFLFLFTGKKKSFVFIVLLISFFSGILANPVRTGLQPILNNSLFLNIREQTVKDEGVWIVENLYFPINNYPVMAGAPTINCTNTYPNLSLMYTLDPIKKYEDIYNRYGSFMFIITNEETRFELLNPDLFNIYINVDDVVKLNSRFILTNRNLEQFSNSKVSFVKIKDIFEYKIYEIKHLS
ncbi:MAG: hypothetical protein J6T23_06520 [Elusimicrobia bacterium]|nr:hypothetical protein [Elusimicrobiota bacterium]